MSGMICLPDQRAANCIVAYLSLLTVIISEEWFLYDRNYCLNRQDRVEIVYTIVTINWPEGGGGGGGGLGWGSLSFVCRDHSGHMETILNPYVGHFMFRRQLRNVT